MKKLTKCPNDVDSSSSDIRADSPDVTPMADRADVDFTCIPMSSADNSDMQRTC